MVASVTRLKAAAMTVHYFEADGYYAKDDPEHRKASGWCGEAAVALGLQGTVKPQRFEEILDEASMVRDAAHVWLTSASARSIRLPTLLREDTCVWFFSATPTACTGRSASPTVTC